MKLASALSSGPGKIGMHMHNLMKIKDFMLVIGLLSLAVLGAHGADLDFARADASSRVADPYSLLGTGFGYSGSVNYEGLSEPAMPEPPLGFGVDVSDPAGVNLRGGNLWQSAQRYQLSSQSGRLNFGLTNPRYNSGFYGGLRYGHDAQNQFSLFGQYTRQRHFPPTQFANSPDLGVIGASWLRALDRSGKSLFLASLFVGDERDADNRVATGKELYGLRLAGQTALNDKTDLFAAFRAQHGKYPTHNIQFQAARQDSQYDLSFGLNWRFAPNWSLRPELTYTKNQSNVVTYEYDRTDFSVTVRRDFR